MNSMVQAKQLIRATLLDSTSLQALLGEGGAIYTAHPEEPDSSQVKMPCVILDARGGAGGYQGGFQHLSLHLYTYSRKGADEADAVYDAAYAALQMTRLVSAVTVTGGARANATAGTCRETTRPEAGWNQALGAWWSRGTWIASTAG